MQEKQFLLNAYNEMNQYIECNSNWQEIRFTKLADAEKQTKSFNKIRNFQLEKVIKYN